MADFLNGCVVALPLAAIIAIMADHEDAPALAILAIAAVVFRVARGEK